MNNVISGDYKGQGVMLWGKSVVITLPMFKTVKLNQATVLGYSLIDNKTVSIQFRDGKHSVLKVNRKIYGILIETLPSFCSGISFEQITAPKPYSKKRVGLKCFLLIFLLILDVQFLKMFPQGYMDVPYWGMLLFFLALTGLLIYKILLVQKITFRKNKQNLSASDPQSLERSTSPDDPRDIEVGIQVAPLSVDASTYYEEKVTKEIYDNARLFETDLVIMSAHGASCSDCAKYQGRVFSLTGSDKRFPKLPDCISLYGGVHPGCGHTFSVYIHGVNDPMLEYTLSFQDDVKPQYRKDIVAFSNRPFIDDRLPETIRIAEAHKAEITSTVIAGCTTPDIDFEQIIRDENDWRRQQRGLSPIEYELERIDSMDGHTFEQWCANLLAANGFLNVEVTPGSNDQGVDIVAEKGGVRHAFQCKCYSSDLGNTPVQQVYAGKEMYNCQVGIVMTNRYFTAGAKQLAERTKVLLWDRDKLIELLEQAQ